MSDFKYILSVCAIMKYENRFVVEWIEYHHFIGVDHFYIYDNDINSGLPELLKYYTDNGIVTLIPFSGQSKQFVAYTDALTKYKDESKYIAFIDADEFIVTKLDEPVFKTVDNMFNSYNTDSKMSALGINWRIFGTNHHKERPDGLVIDNYILYGNTDDNRHIKSIINPRLCNSIDNPHYGLYQKDCYCKSQNGDIIHGPFYIDYDKNYTPLRIHHYIFKSLEDFKFRLFKKKSSHSISDKEDLYNANKDDYLLDKYGQDIKHNMIVHGYNFITGQGLWGE